MGAILAMYDKLNFQQLQKPDKTIGNARNVKETFDNYRELRDHKNNTHADQPCDFELVSNKQPN